MQIISHRGYWKTAAEKNSEIAFARSFSHGFGTETDVRDTGQELVISHDSPDGGEMRLIDFFKMVVPTGLPVALNIKADGLAARCRQIADVAGMKNWFVFDMSIPDMKSHILVGNPVYTRMSDVETCPIWLDQSSGVWLDSFSEQCLNPEIIMNLVCANKRVCIVSPELHGRKHLPTWDCLRKFWKFEEVMLCTDLPEDARAFFSGE